MTTTSSPSSDCSYRQAVESSSGLEPGRNEITDSPRPAATNRSDPQTPESSRGSGSGWIEIAYTPPSAATKRSDPPIETIYSSSLAPTNSSDPQIPEFQMTDSPSSTSASDRSDPRTPENAHGLQSGRIDVADSLPPVTTNHASTSKSMETFPIEYSSASDNSSDSDGSSPRSLSTSSSSSSDEETSLLKVIDRCMSINELSESSNLYLEKYLKDLALKYVNRGEQNSDAVIIFTFTRTGDKWKTSEERPAIIIPSKLFPLRKHPDGLKNNEHNFDLQQDEMASPIEDETKQRSLHKLISEGYIHDLVKNAMAYLAKLIENTEGIAPFVSCIDFGQYEVGRELDFVLSRDIHEAPLYLHTCTILPSLVLKVPTIPVPARYYHNSCDGPSSSFETSLFVEREEGEDTYTYFEPITHVEDTLGEINSRLGEEVRKNLDAKLKLYFRYAQCKAMIFTNDANLWAAEEGPLIIFGEPTFPINLERYGHDHERIAVDVTKYLIAAAKSEACKNICVHYLRYNNGCVDYGVHLILIEEFVPVERFMRQEVCNTGLALSPQFEPVLCCTCTPKSHHRPDVSVIWVKRRPANSSTRLYEQNPSEQVPSILVEKARAELDRMMLKFIEHQFRRGRRVTVIFTRNQHLWRIDGKSKIIFERSICNRHLSRPDMAREITDYLQKLALRAEVGPLNVSYLRLEQKEGSYFHLVLSPHHQPALTHLEECQLKSKPDVEDYLANVTKLSDGIYHYRSPIDERGASSIAVRVTRKFRGILD